MSSLTIHCPAKINLFLNVLDKRPDGYHDLETVFERISLYDTLTFSARPAGIEVISDDSSLNAYPEDNLIYRAISLIQQETGCNKGVRCELTKRIPMGSGLGGGSSDAAGAMKAVLELWGQRIQPERLQELGAQLGADIPFFLADMIRAVGEGKGERLRPLPEEPKYDYVVVAPEVRASTAEIYRRYDPSLDLTVPQNNIRVCTCALTTGNRHELAESLFNSLEKIVVSNLPIVSKIKKVLADNGSIGASMTGSGTGVFGIAASCGEAENVAAALRVVLDDCRVFSVATA